MANPADIGVLGLSTMGANLARNAARKGFGVAVYNRHTARTDELIANHGAEGRFAPAKTIAEFVAALARPRPIIILVKAGKPVDDVIAELAPHLDEGDIIIDGGNSLFTDTNRRFHALEEKGLRFIGMGVSGGEEGALEGPSMMPGGDREAYARIEPMVTKMAAQVEGAPCCTFIGPEGAGHYVKMVHNGIEYADMQLITEAYDLFKSVYGLDAAAIAGIFEEWKAGELDSYLIEITAAVLRKRDAAGGALVDAIVDEAEQKGTGRWTAQSALDLGVPLTSITEAVYARALSGRRAQRLAAEKFYTASGDRPAKAREGRHRRDPECALRLEDRRLRPGVRTDDGGVRTVRLGPPARRGLENLARRLHHTRPLPRPHPRGLRRRQDGIQPTAGRLFPRRRGEGGARLAPRRIARGRAGRSRAGLHFVARLLRRAPAQPRPSQPAAGIAGLFRRAHLSPAGPGRQFSYPLGPGRGGGRRRGIARTQLRTRSPTALLRLVDILKARRSTTAALGERGYILA